MTTRTRCCKKNRNAETGFSLIEMLIVLAILSSVMAVVFTAVSTVQKRERVVEAKVDLNQESREFLDEIVRDLHQAGYPTVSMFASASGATTSRSFVAAGLVNATATSLQFEGDIDGNAQVDVVTYTLASSTGVTAGQCPCVLQRGQVAKTDNTAPGSQPLPTATTEVDGIINSAGNTWAQTPWVISGTAPNGVSNDTQYANFKTQPVFRYYNSSGAEVAPPGTNATNLADIHAIRITINVLSPAVDTVWKTNPVNTVSGSARISNTSN